MTEFTAEPFIQPLSVFKEAVLCDVEEFSVF